METGYTSFINDGSITTGRDFLKLCLRNFGIAVSMRDEPLTEQVPTHFEPNPYYAEMYSKSVIDRDKVRQMTFEDAKQALIDRHNNIVNNAKETLAKYKAEDAKYQKIADEIEKWVPPTPEHESIKRFALAQIEASMNTSCYEYIKADINSELDTSDDAVHQYLKEINEVADRTVQMRYKDYQREIERTKEKNLYMEQFLDSLKDM